MPIYEYRCHTCGKEFEIQAKIADEAPKRGRDCVSSKCTLEKMVSLSAKILSRACQAGTPDSGLIREIESTQKPTEAAKATCVPGCAHLTH